MLLICTTVLLIASLGYAVAEEPNFWKKAETARWLAHENIWGTLSTSSVHLNGQAWGQPKSFVDGTINNSTGVLYFYDSDMDTSLQDIAANPTVSFSLTKAQLPDGCLVSETDPEDPTCARVVFSGTFEVVDDEDENKFAKSALFERHPAMATWPEDHSWKIHKIANFKEIWLIDIYGGASIIPADQYYTVDMSAMSLNKKV